MNVEERDGLLATLKERFERHMHRHQGIAWADVLTRPWPPMRAGRVK